MKDQLFETTLNLLKLTISKKTSFRKIGHFSLSEHLSIAQPIFILSPGRSATQSISRSYLYKLKVVSYHKSSPELKLLPQSIWSMNEDERHVAALVSRCDHIIDCHLCDLTYIESNHHLSLFGKGLVDAYPNGIFIHISRKKSDFVESSLRRGSGTSSFIDRGKIFRNEYPENMSVEQRKEFICRNYDAWVNRINEIENHALESNFFEVPLQRVSSDIPKILSRYMAVKHHSISWINRS